LQKTTSADGKEVQLYCHSTGRQAKEVAMVERFCKRFEAGLQKLADGLTSAHGEKNPDKLLQRIGQLKAKSHGISQHYTITLEVEKADVPGTPEISETPATAEPALTPNLKSAHGQHAHNPYRGSHGYTDRIYKNLGSSAYAACAGSSVFYNSQLTLTCTSSSPFGSVTWMAQAMQGSKLCTVRKISRGCLVSINWWLCCKAASYGPG